MSDPQPAEASHESTPALVEDSAIDPSLADLPAPSRPGSASAQPEEHPNDDPTDANELEVSVKRCEGLGYS